jgi:SEC-C motif
VPGPGRNQPCPCGSGRKTSRCCGEQRGPSEDQLVRARLAGLAQIATEELGVLSETKIEVLWKGLFDLPGVPPGATSGNEEVTIDWSPSHPDAAGERAKSGPLAAALRVVPRPCKRCQIGVRPGALAQNAAIAGVPCQTTGRDPCLSQGAHHNPVPQAECAVARPERLVC